MKRNTTFLVILFTTISATLLIGKGFRVDQVPNGDKFNCNTCHTSGGGTPRNSFGLKVQSITGSDNVNFWGPTLAALDSDGDGFSNGVELQDPNGEWTTGSAAPGDASAITHPGDASDFPPLTSVDDITNLPYQFELGNNYPNPFNPTTNITFSIASNSNVTLEVYNSIGEKVRELINDYYSPGSYSTVWNAKDDFGNKVNSGVYIYRLVANNYVETKRMVLLK